MTAAEEESSESKLPVVVRTAIEAAFAAAPSVADLFFGPGAGIAAASVASLGDRVGEALAARLSRRVRDVSEGARAAGLDFEALAAQIEADERAMELWRRVVRAGIESPWETKRRALGRALAEGRLGEPGFDRELRVVRAFEAVEEWDVRVLDFIDRLEDRRDEKDKPNAIMGAARVATVEDLRAEFTEDVVDFVVENLESSGLVDNVGVSTYGAKSMWVSTRIADDVLRLIRAAAAEEEGLLRTVGPSW